MKLNLSLALYTRSEAFGSLALPLDMTKPDDIVARRLLTYDKSGHARHQIHQTIFNARQAFLYYVK